MSRIHTTHRLLPLLALLCAVLVALPRAAPAQDISSVDIQDLPATDADEDESDDDLFDFFSKFAGQRSPSASRRARHIAHFAIKPEVRFGLRHAFDKDLSLEIFVRDRQIALDNPLALRASAVSGGVEMVRKFGATTWMVTFETGEAFSRFYQHTTRTAYDLHTTLQHQFKFGGTAVSITPRVELGQQWSDNAKEQRWKFVLKAPVAYQLSDTLVLLPLIPKLTYEPYPDRADNRTDWTMNISAGIRWFMTPTAYVETEFGFENRWSNVHNDQYSRWVLAPKINLRMSF